VSAAQPVSAKGPVRLEARSRPVAAGKFLEVAGETLWLRGVTYGTFRPNSEGALFPEPAVAARDLEAMATAGINAVRVYKLPPRWLLDLAEARGIRVLAGFDWTQHVAFLESRSFARAIVDEVRAGVRSLAGHPALLAWCIGNEIPGPVVRWHGHRRIERFLAALFEEVKARDPQGLVTYVNYPTTEYLELPFLDFAAFNVYLESRDRLAAYLARLHNLIGDRPLVMAELGLDSRSHGEERQAEVLSWQLRETFEAGCAGAFVFSWTSEWYAGGVEMLDWDFGLTSRTRTPKPALDAVKRAYAEVPIRAQPDWPRISVVVCSHNGSATLPDTLDGLGRLDYPDHEVIVVDDGSTDATAEIARRHGAQLVSTPHEGLAKARNAGIGAARGAIVAFLDDDAHPDPHWLTYLVLTLRGGDFCGVGGPDLLPAGAGDVAECVANSPGGPAHVLLTDREAEHLPGCNTAFRKDWLAAVGGFDPRFRTAGGDVDLCWTLRERGGRLGFHPAAFVWRHRHGSLRRYWQHQVEFGKSEALLARKWPQKYDAASHIVWSGRIYGRGLTPPFFGQLRRIYHGIWGSAPFQSRHRPLPRRLEGLPLLPEWYLLILALAALAALGALWPPLRSAVPALALAAGCAIAQAARNAACAELRRQERSRPSRWGMRALIGVLHLLQPAARLYGRLRHGLGPWRSARLSSWTPPRPRCLSLWSESWRPHAAWVEALESALSASRVRVSRAGSHAPFDLSVAAGLFGGARTLMAVEEHGRGRQCVRLRVWPTVRRGVSASLLAAALAAAAFLEGAWLAGSVLAAVAAAPPLAALLECGCSEGEILRALGELGDPPRVGPELRSGAGELRATRPPGRLAC
jgi:GT2 family glycosyltransferase